MLDNANSLKTEAMRQVPRVIAMVRGIGVLVCFCVSLFA